ncbi:MAG: tyrosine-type recombinase/integrase [Deltaproteobacteria bacterium]|nr:tyrosine-type recombinase/integrase [Deltaproteobacteria bacterium]
MAERIYKRGGVYYGDFRALGGKQESLGVKSKAAARAEYRKRELALCERRLGPLPLGMVLTFALEAKKRRAKAHGRDVEKALRTGRQHCEALERHLGDLGLDFNDPNLSLEGAGEDFLDKRTTDETNKGTFVMPHTALKNLKTLAQGLREARKRNCFEGEPSDVIPEFLTDGAVYTPSDRWLKDNEFAAVLREAPEHRRKDFILGVETGADHGELIKVDKDEDVDLSIVRGPYGAGRLPATKTEERDRWIPLSRAAREAVDECLAEEGRYLVPVWHNFKRDMENPCKRAEVKPFIWKDIRRTFASRCAQAGVPEYWVVKLMGHADSKMIRRVYARLSPATYAEAIKRLEAVPYVTHVSHAEIVELRNYRETDG